ncbi:MAG: MarR family winged helix-turn-helix transcriptional regulator [Crocinitomicaceae bacterium]
MKIEEELQSKFKSEHHKLVVNLHLTFVRITARFQDLMKEHGLTATQYNVLRILRGQNQKPASIGLIKERMIEKNSDVSRIIDRLLKKDLIERKANKADRRQKDVIINESGLAILEKIGKAEDDFYLAFGDIDENEVKTMNDFLDKIRSKTKSDDA